MRTRIGALVFGLSLIAATLGCNKKQADNPPPADNTAASAPAEQPLRLRHLRPLPLRLRLNNLQ